jgi:hypothetical protein
VCALQKDATSGGKGAGSSKQERVRDPKASRLIRFFATTTRGRFTSDIHASLPCVSMYVQTLRRLAQNREAARKSRLRKKVRRSIYSQGTTFTSYKLTYAYRQKYVQKHLCMATYALAYIYKILRAALIF